MKIYFHMEETADVLDAKDILKYLKQAGVDLINDGSGGLKKNALNLEQPLDKVDALIVQAKKLDANSGYLIALAISQKKQVLCLLPQKTRLDSSMEKLKKNSKYLRVEFYDNKNLPNKIFDFLKYFDNSSFGDVINIKYTLRLSSRISEYITWKSKQAGLRKADWLREQIKKMMKEDEDYKNYLKNKFGKSE